jgi:5'-nucleotidase (lipoprotein e(P4) family)
LFVLVILAPGCASGRPPGAAPAPAATPAQPVASANLPDSLKWVERSAEYHAGVLQTFRVATAAVERHAAASAARPWAVVLDADETVLSNLQYQIERHRAGAGFTPESWNAWVRRRESTALPGAARFLARVRALGGRIAIVTNRLQSECDDTAAVFRSAGLAFDAMLCRPDGGPSDKNPRFAAVAAGQTPAGQPPLEVAAFVGDNIQDFPALTQAARQQGESAFAEFGVRYFMLPNPMYGGWQ